ncbi:MAG TPA: MarR family transcriptional regulator [Verrucomicrobiae bacterium]|nr:MarR family transcriptional regulator [Verrucomicrobiae bacterium]
MAGPSPRSPTLASEAAAAADAAPGPRLDAAVTTIVRWSTRHDVRAEVMRRARCDLPTSAVWLLGRVADCGPVHPSELAAFHQVDASTITPRLQRLEREGLVRREPDPLDGRAALVRATPAGTRLLARLHGARQTLLEDILHDWPPQRRARVADALTELAERLG